MRFILGRDKKSRNCIKNIIYIRIYHEHQIFHKNLFINPLKTYKSQCAWSLGEGVKTFQIGSSQAMIQQDSIQAGTGESAHSGDFVLIFLNRPSTY